MKYGDEGQENFFSELAEHQISAREFFGNVLLDSLARNFGLNRAVIFYFDTEGRFLSWVNWNGILPDGEGHPYRRFLASDLVRRRIYEEAVRDRLTYFHVTPRLYQATKLIGEADYESSSYVRFLEETFQAHYSLTMAFGINGYIQVAFLKSREEGDFTGQEIAELNKIYGYLANSYKNFKKYEQAKIVSNIQSEIIASGERAYLVTDDFMHIMSYNQMAQEYLKGILGETAGEQLSSASPCSWLPFLLGGNEDGLTEERVHTRVIQNYVFKIYTYDQRYSNGIVDRYHWITISPREPQMEAVSAGKAARERTGNSGNAGNQTPLTQTERRVAELMQQGLTYKAIADELVVSYHTVKKHVQNIYTKCGVNSRFQLYQWMEREGG